jgi:hypothetical protein
MNVATYRNLRTKGLVKAVQIHQLNQVQVATWCDGMAIGSPPAMSPDADGAVQVPTPDGCRRANDGEYVVQNSAGEFWHYAPGAFLETHELVEERAPDVFDSERNEKQHGRHQHYGGAA